MGASLKVRRADEFPGLFVFLFCWFFLLTNFLGAEASQTSVIHDFNGLFGYLCFWVLYVDVFLFWLSSYLFVVNGCT